MVPLIREVYIRNYKSIGQAFVELSPLTAFVGPNGAGKSNFVDCLAFVQQCLSESVELAFKSRGGIGAVRRSSGGHPTHLGVRLVLDLAGGSRADYAFEIAARPTERYEVARERCIVWPHMQGRDRVSFEVMGGEFRKPIPGIRPQIPPDRLALFAASNTDEFRPVYDFLTAMRFYAVQPARLRELQDPDPGDFLKRDGSNAAAVLRRLKEAAEENGRYERLCTLLSKVVTGVRRVDPRSVGQKETLEFKQDVGQKHPWKFSALSMSDGTLRVLGLLLALYQPGDPTVVGIEEPEATVHPAVAELVVDVLQDASHERQVLFTTHSPDIVDHKDLTDRQIRVVTAEANRTLICGMSAASRQAVREQLYTPGELLRVGELAADLDEAKKAAARSSLWSAEPPP